jgi:deoxyribose-phosphate aldolase
MQDTDIDRIVETIAARVRERLDAAGCTDACDASALDCTACGDCLSRREEDARTMLSIGAVRLSAGPNPGPVASDLAGYIDHTLLKPEATKEQLRTICEEARRYGFRTVCVNSANVRFCKGLLAGSAVKVVAVIGFPLGAMSTASKVFETREAVRDGAEEIDMVMNIGKLKSGDYDCVLEDIRKVVEAARPKPVKVILETGGLDTHEKIISSALSKTAGAAFVKTSTGFGPGGATAEDVALMKQVVGPGVEVKASGGIRDEQTARKMIAAGATRLGVSASIAIVTGKDAGKGKY